MSAELLGVPGGQRLLERGRVDQLGPTADPAHHAPALQHVEITPYGLGGDPELLADLGDADRGRERSAGTR